MRFMVATGAFLSHKPIAPYHKSQTAGWLYGGSLFFRRGRGWPLAELRPQGAKCLALHPQWITMVKPGASVCARQILPSLLGGCPAPLHVLSTLLHLPSSEESPSQPVGQPGNPGRLLSLTWTSDASPPWLMSRSLGMLFKAAFSRLPSSEPQFQDLRVRPRYLNFL